MAILVKHQPNCIVYEDDHLLVVNKPAGLNTHAPSPFAGEGIYEWLRHRQPSWATLATIQRLDKETSGIILFSKSTLANKSLTQQFESRKVEKEYLLLTDCSPSALAGRVHTGISRVGDKYIAGPIESADTEAETWFTPAGKTSLGWLIKARPLTGRTHQIRVHAASRGCPLLGDVTYGGTPFGRVCLHAERLRFQHPLSRQPMEFCAPVDFGADVAAPLRTAVIDTQATNAWRVWHGIPDRRPGWFVERWGDWLLSQSERDLTRSQVLELKELGEKWNITGAYHKRWLKSLRNQSFAETSPSLLFCKEGASNESPRPFVITEHDVKFEASFAEGYSVGIFLDQRENRRRFLQNHIAAGFPIRPQGLAGCEVLNTFAYTCGFSVCAALGGAKVTSLDLSKKYLDWGRRNFLLNGLDPSAHDFIFGDVFDWLQRFAKKGRKFEVIILDPPTFSQSKESGIWKAEQDYAKLVQAALPVLASSGILLASTNAATVKPETFVSLVEATVTSARRKVLKRHYAAQPIDFPMNREQPGYLKTLWLHIS